MLFKKILCAVDGSKHSERAMEYARGVARTQGAELTLLHCPGHIPTLVGGHAREQLKKELLEDGQKILDRFLTLCENFEVQCKSDILTGTPGDVIVSYCQDNGYDLIVMGSRGRSDIEGLILGSVTHHVLQRCSCPVMIIR